MGRPRTIYDPATYNPAAIYDPVKCATPGCRNKPNGTAYHCGAHMRPSLAVLNAVYAAVSANPSGTLRDYIQATNYSHRTVTRALSTLEGDGVLTPPMRVVLKVPGGPDADA